MKYLKSDARKQYLKNLFQEDYRCGTCSWFGKRPRFRKGGCKRNEKLINALPCENWELEDQKRKEATRKTKEFMELKEQLGRGAITQEEYERKKKLLEGLTELWEQLDRGAINLAAYEQKKRKLLEKSET